MYYVKCSKRLQRVCTVLNLILRSDYNAPDMPSLFAPELRARKTPITHRDAVVNSFVFVHRTLFEANSRLQKRGGRTMAITPRHFLGTVSHSNACDLIRAFLLIHLESLVRVSHLYPDTLYCTM